MRIDLEDLRRHYASLADEELVATDPDELTEAAKAVYEKEFARRKLPSRPEVGAAGERDDRTALIDQPDEIEDGVGEFDIDTGPPPDWLEDAAQACAFSSLPVMNPNDVEKAAKARIALRRAGIPCYITSGEEDDPPPEPDAPVVHPFVYVMVPGALGLHATSILDREIFNEEKEAAWRNHLGRLSDTEVSALDPEVFCAGPLDLAARLTKAYDDEIARRQLQPRDTSRRGTGAG